MIYILSIIAFGLGILCGYRLLLAEHQEFLDYVFTTENLIDRFSNDNIKYFLEHSYTGARMNDDIETQTRLARALAAYEADLEMDIFTKDFEDYYYSKLD